MPKRAGRGIGAASAAGGHADASIEATDTINGIVRHVARTWAARAAAARQKPGRRARTSVAPLAVGGATRLSTAAALRRAGYTL